MKHKRVQTLLLTMASDKTISAEFGSTLEIYVGVDSRFDVSTGTKVNSLGAGTYENVVILVK